MCAVRGIAPIPAHAVFALLAQQIWRQRQAGLGGQMQGRSQQRVQAHALIGELMHERGIRPVFQQTPDQISQQVAMSAHGSVDAQANQRIFQYFAVDAFAHAMQAL